MLHILFLFVTGLLLFCSEARGSVFEFNQDGSITKHEAFDYLSKSRHPRFTLPALHTQGKNKYQPIIKRAARKNGVDKTLIHALILMESAYDNEAVSVKGAQGLMQLMPETAELYNVSDPFDPEQNIDAGTRHLRKLLDKYKGNTELALAAYNAGIGAVEQYHGIPPYRETQSYVSKIMSLIENQ